MSDAVKQRLSEIREKQLELQTHTRTSRDLGMTKDKTLYLVAIGGVAAGITIAVIAWLAWSLMTTKQVSTGVPRPEATIHTNTINEMNQKIGHLSEQIVVLTNTITDLEKRFVSFISAPKPDIDSGNKSPVTYRGEKPAPSDIRTFPENASIDASKDIEAYAESVAFASTHRVTERVNLRPMPSTDKPAIATLKAGSEVQYLREKDDWSFVKTELYGEGWVASEYLSPKPVQ
jgi:hypothetical protein